VVGIAAIIGYMWYADMLPFDSPDTSLGMSGNSNIRQISDAVVPNGKKTVYYSFEDVPSIPDKQIPVNALKKAIQTWEENNPQLEFVQSQNSNLEIKWQKYASSTHTGLATCNSVLFGILSHCVLDISVGAEDCNGDFIQNDENMVINILMHEIGHSLGLGHSSQIDHLMYSTESPQITFDDKGYIIPQRFEELYVGQKLLLEQEKEIRSEIKSIDLKISREKSQYDEYLKQYEYYKGKTLSSDDYQKAQRIFEKLTTQGEKVNSMIDEQNMMIEQINTILNQLGCNPNFELTS